MKGLGAIFGSGHGKRAELVGLCAFAGLPVAHRWRGRVGQRAGSIEGPHPSRPTAPRCRSTTPKLDATGPTRPARIPRSPPNPAESSHRNTLQGCRVACATMQAREERELWA
jgi:hypothetical protein